MMKRFLVCVGVVSAAVASTYLPGVSGSAGRAAEPQSAASVAPADVGEACARALSVTLAHGTVTSAEVVEAGSFVPPSGGRPLSAEALARTYGSLPSFCRVALTLTPSDDSDINVELWMPATTWNARFQAVGNGAFTGSIRHNSMAAAVSLGYASASTDTGHLGNTASFGLGHPEKVIDFGWRAVHEMTVAAKEVIAVHYDEDLRYSYWNGCSAGGRQAMKAAQRFPEDFDGIIAGAPGQDWTGRAAASLRVATHLEANEEARLLESDRTLVYDAAIAACDAGDGVVDGVISAPESCTFDPAVLRCEAEKRASCLTTEQVDVAKMLYSSPANPATGRAITGLYPGSERGWTDLGWTNSARSTGLEQYRYLVYADPEWTIDAFDFDTDIAKAEAMDDDTLNALDPNLKPFFDRGGKLIAYHGWADPQISPANATQYHGRVVDAIGSAATVDASYRLFMAPGMGHCGGGVGPNSFDMVTAIEQWVEEDQAPAAILAAHRTDGEVDQTRPLCPYPQVAVYSGSGSTDEAENFVCRVP